MKSPCPPAGRVLATLAALLVLVLPARATWSIVVIDLSTGEVGVAGATCLVSSDLLRFLPVIRVGDGAGVAQGQIDGGFHKGIIWDGIIAGKTPDQILVDLVNMGIGMGQRQFGIVARSGPSATFSGFLLGPAFGGLTGEADGIRYAIQGNVITGTPVITAAENALIHTPGDLSQKLMAAMEAARSMGGDGRCSCSTGPPPSCGSPPPSFTKSAHSAFVVLARMGDPDGICASLGCATAPYYVKLQFKGNPGDPDPVIELQNLYDTWRAGLSGRPDHLLSTAVPDAASLVADGVTSTTVRIRLVDVDGVPLASGGATIGIATLDGSPPHATSGPVTDNGDGTYELTLTAGTTPGADTFVLTADDGTARATLFPFLPMAVDPLAPLHVGVDELSVGGGGDVPFVINLGPGAGGHPYVLLGSLSGTSPGIDLGGGVTLPLNPDAFLHATLALAGTGVLPGSIGTLDAGGRAEAGLSAPPALMVGFVGLRSDWAAVDYNGPFAVTNGVGLDFTP